MAQRITQKFVWLVLLLWCTTFALGQSMSSTGPGRWNQSTLVSSFPDFANDSVNHGRFNCWYLTTGYAPIVNVSTGRHVVAIDTDRHQCLPESLQPNPWHLERTNCLGLWAAESGVRRDGNIYALSSAMCDSTHHWIAKWSGSAWANTGGCGPDFSLDQAGGNMSVAIGTENAVWSSTNYWQSGTMLQACYDRNWALSVSEISSQAGQFMVICNDNTIWIATWTGGTNVTYRQLPGAGYMAACGVKRSGLLCDRHGPSCLSFEQRRNRVG